MLNSQTLNFFSLILQSKKISYSYHIIHHIFCHMQMLKEGIDDVFKQRIRNKIKQGRLYKQHILHKNIEDFNFLTLLGSGSFGRVCLAELKEDHKVYAIKTINKAEIIRENDIDVTMAERRILALGNKSTFLTQLYCSFQVFLSYYFFVCNIFSSDI